MATSYKVIAQYITTSTDLETLWTVPSSTEAVISTIIVANLSSSARTFSIAIRPNGDTINNKHYIAKDVPVAGNDSTTLTLGITVDAADVISVQSSVTGELSFNAFGTLITP
jgi:hypothetical protein